FTGLYTHERTAGLAIYKVEVNDIIFGIAMFLVWLGMAIPGFRYLSFAIPFLVLVGCMSNRAVFNTSMVKAFAWYIAFALATFPRAHRDGFKDLFLSFSGLSIMLLPTIPKLRLWAVFTWMLLAFLCYFGLGGALFRMVHIDLAKSYSNFECDFAFVFSLLLPIAAMQRRWVIFLLSAFLAVISLKRIALLGAFAACVFVFVPRKLGMRLINKWTMLAVNVIVLFIGIVYAHGTFDHAIENRTGQSANQLGMGRRYAQHEAAKTIVDAPYKFVVFGQGAGRAYDAATKGAGMLTKINMHNDLLKLMYEFGLVFFCVFFFLLYDTPSYKQRVILLYYNFLLFTDNALIYYFVLFCMAMLMRTYCDDDLTEPAAEPKKQVDKPAWQY
ncbi:MAG: hypothetical protein RI907_1670, partial [Pseudomonadota bacterium]